MTKALTQREVAAFLATHDPATMPRREFLAAWEAFVAAAEDVPPIPPPTRPTREEIRTMLGEEEFVRTREEILRRGEDFDGLFREPPPEREP